MSANIQNIPPRMTRRYMNHFIICVIIWCGFGACATGAVFSGLLNALNLTDPQIGFVTALGSLCLPLQLAGSLIQPRYFRRKPFYLTCIVTYYSCYLLLALLAAFWTNLSATVAVALFFGIQLVCYGSVQLGGALVNAWMGEIIPPRESAEFWNRRGGAALIFSMICGLVVGKVVDVMGKDNINTYVILMIIGVIFGYCSLYVYLILPDRDTREDFTGSPISQIKEVLKNRQFQALTAFFAVGTVAECCCAGFYNIFLLKNMNFSMVNLQILTIMGSLAGIAGAFFFRIIGSKYGNKSVLALCVSMKVVEFLLCAFLWIPGGGFLDKYCHGVLQSIVGAVGLTMPALDAGFYMVLPSFLVAGFFNTGRTASLMALLTSTGARHLRSISIAIYGAVMGVLGFTVFSLSGFFYKYLNSAAWVKEFNIEPYSVLTFCTAVGFALSLFLLRYLKEDGGLSAGDMIKALFSGNPVRMVYQAHVLSQPIGEQVRTRKLRQFHSNIISDELIQGLYSPSSRVRDSALLNLSTMEGKVTPAVEDELIRLLNIPELGQQAMAARTLGRLRVRKSVPALIDHFKAPDLALSQACIFAAGLLGDVSAEKVLLEILADMRYQDRWLHAAEALSRLGTGDFRYTKNVFRVLSFESYAVTRQQTLISLARLIMHDRNSAYIVFDSENRRPGSEIEKLLKQISLHPAWKTFLPECKTDFESWMDAYDAGKYSDCMQDLLMLELALYGITPKTPDIPAQEFLSQLFVAGGMRVRELEADTYEANNLWVQLKLWVELRFDTDGTDRFLLLLQLIAASELLPRRMQDNGRLNGC